MKKAIITLVILSVLVFSVANASNSIAPSKAKNNTALSMTYPNLQYEINTGDQYLYNRTSTDVFYDFVRFFASNVSSGFSDLYYIYNETSNYDNNVSYNIFDSENSYYLANKTEYSILNSVHFYKEEWIPLGGGSFQYNTTANYTEYRGEETGFFTQTYLENNSVTAFDINTGYSSSRFNYTSSFWWNTTINGHAQTIFVSEYILEAYNKETYNTTKYDVTYPITYISETSARILVDNESKIILHYDLYDLFQFNYSTEQYSNNYQSDLVLEETQISVSKDSWDIIETTAYYEPLNVDADIPAIIYQTPMDPTIDDGITSLEIPIYIVDSSDNLSLNVYANDYFVFEIDDIAPGLTIVSIPEYKLWPDPESGCVTISIEIWDQYGHFSGMWTVVYEDYRNFDAKWLPWIEGPSYTGIFQANDPEYIEFQIYASTIWNLTVEILYGDIWEAYGEQTGYKNMTYALDLHYLPEGSYTCRILFKDYSDNFLIFNFSIDYYPPYKDYTDPTIYGPSGLETVYTGNISQLTWYVYDMHPNIIYLYDSAISDEPLTYAWTSNNETVTYNIDPNLAIDHQILIVAVDQNNNTATLQFTLNVVEPENTDTTPTSTTNETSTSPKTLVAQTSGFETPLIVSALFLYVIPTYIRKKKHNNN